MDMRECRFENTNLSYTEMKNIDFSWCDFIDVNLEGEDIFCTRLENTKLDGIKTDKNTKHFEMKCPETGPVIGRKMFSDNRFEILLIPAMI